MVNTEGGREGGRIDEWLCLGGPGRYWGVDPSLCVLTFVKVHVSFAGVVL